MLAFPMYRAVKTHALNKEQISVKATATKYAPKAIPAALHGPKQLHATKTSPAIMAPVLKTPPHARINAPRMAHSAKALKSSSANAKAMAVLHGAPHKIAPIMELARKTNV